MKHPSTRLLSSIIVALSLFMQGCIKDSCMEQRSYSWFEPVYSTKEAVRNNIKSNAPKAIESTGKIFILGNYIFLNEIDKGIHVINNSNPAAPINEAFISIPGNVDLSVKGNTLYADMYTDLVAIDISNPLNVRVQKIVNNMFPHRSYGFANDTSQIIIDWVRRDTTVTLSCETNEMYFLTDAMGTPGIGVSSTALSSNSSSYAGGSPTGIAGSMSRFALSGDYLYTVGYTELKAVNIRIPESPVWVNSINLPWGIETIYPMLDKLFIGGNSGMYIYSIANPTAPVQLGSFSHARVCDPVISDGTHAYVTLRNGTNCQGFLNELDVLDISNIMAPTLLKQYDLFNPHGLSKTNNLLFVCDGTNGVKVFDATDVMQLNLKKHITGLNAFDAISYNNLLIVVAEDGLYQYNFSNSDNIQQISKIAANQ